MLQHFPDSMLRLHIKDTIQILEKHYKKNISGILVTLVDLLELGMEDAAPENLLKLMTQLDMVIQIISLKWGGVCGKCTHILYCHKITIIAQCCVSMS